MRDVGHGSLKAGEKVLDRFVQKVRNGGRAEETAAAPINIFAAVTPTVTPNYREIKECLVLLGEIEVLLLP